MPAFAGRLNKSQAKQLVAHIRGFAPQPVAEKKPVTTPATVNTGTQFDEEFLRLQREFDDLHKQLQEIRTEENAAKKTSAAVKKSVSSKAIASAPRAPELLFRQLCLRCHGPGGEGDRKKGNGDVPDFRLPDWHLKRTDVQLLTSIMKGTEGTMPAFRRQLSEAEARGLVAFVRGFAPSAGQH
jgi:mono/diheme cytochrome c family protein